MYPPNAPPILIFRPASGPSTSVLPPGRSLNSRIAGISGRRANTDRMTMGSLDMGPPRLRCSDGRPPNVSSQFLNGRRDPLRQIHRRQSRVAHLLGEQIAGEAVQVDAGAGRVEGVDAARE